MSTMILAVLLAVITRPAGVGYAAGRARSASVGYDVAYVASIATALWMTLLNPFDVLLNLSKGVGALYLGARHAVRRTRPLTAAPEVRRDTVLGCVPLRLCCTWTHGRHRCRRWRL